jgi:hypothetical protein
MMLVAGEIERADEVTSPGKKILARVQGSSSDYGLREEIKQIKRTIASESLSAFPVQAGPPCPFFL